MSRIPKQRRLLMALAVLVASGGGVGRSFAAEGVEGRVAEHVTLTNGFDLICDHREQDGDRVKLYTEPGSSNFVEVGAADVASVETIVLPAVAIPASATASSNVAATHADLTKAELHELLSGAGAQHNLDVNLLASVVRAESAGHTAAVSRKGAQGLMQLMPKTAAQLGVNDSLRPEENVAGGASYLDYLLTRYHDNLALALAAYNAGPATVDRCNCVPSYRETRLYVAGVIRDFNASVRNASRNASLEAAKLSHPDPKLQNTVELQTTVARAAHEQAGLTGATAP